MVDNGFEDRAMKKNFLIKEFAEMTKITVRTLHYYDQLGLLKPSYQKANGYRVYTEADLLKLQQIVTLKFMGFSLDQVRELLNSKGYEAVKSLRVQAGAVKDEIARLREASRAIGQVLSLLETEGRINQKKLIKIMEVIQMGEDIKKTWHEKFFTEAELKEFQEVGKKYTPEMVKAYQDRWAALIEEVKQNIKADPASEIAQSLAGRWVDLLNEAYGDHPQLKARIGEAYRSGAVPDDYRMFGAEVWDFIKKAQAAAKKK
jgi:DNA-binding transcriptional MerR regulator